MHMPMINIGKVRMLVSHCDVPMHMFVRHFLIPIEIVRMIVMLVVVGVLVCMRHSVMRVVVLVVFG